MDKVPHVISVKMNGSQKRYQPKKHYVYIIQVKWSDGTEYVIYRSFSAFYDFHKKLLDMFPIEGGLINKRERILPYLPGKKLFRRAETYKESTKRLVILGGYSQAVTKLHPRISHSSHVLQFFKVTSGDLNVPLEACMKPSKSAGLLYKLKSFRTKRSNSADFVPMNIATPMLLDQYVAIGTYTAQDNSEVGFQEGTIISVVEKHDTGWWFVQVESGHDVKQGWAPAAYLEPLDGPQVMEQPPPYSGEKFITVHDYVGEFEDEISFKQGSILEVMYKLNDGWWIVNYNGAVGHVPATFLEPYQSSTDLVKSPGARRLSELHLSIGSGPIRPTPRRCSISTTGSSRYLQSGFKKSICPSLTEEVSEAELDRVSSQASSVQGSPCSSTKSSEKLSPSSKLKLQVEETSSGTSIGWCTESNVLEKPSSLSDFEIPTIDLEIPTSDIEIPSIHITPSTPDQASIAKAQELLTKSKILSNDVSASIRSNRNSDFTFNESKPPSEFKTIPNRLKQRRNTVCTSALVPRSGDYFFARYNAGAGGVRRIKFAEHYLFGGASISDVLPKKHLTYSPGQLVDENSNEVKQENAPLRFV